VWIAEATEGLDARFFVQFSKRRAGEADEDGVWWELLHRRVTSCRPARGEHNGRNKEVALGRSPWGCELSDPLTKFASSGSDWDRRRRKEIYG